MDKVVLDILLSTCYAIIEQLRSIKKIRKVKNTHHVSHPLLTFLFNIIENYYTCNIKRIEGKEKRKERERRAKIRNF